MFAPTTPGVPSVVPSVRVPFEFAFHPPSLALPITRADYLTQHLTVSQKENYLGGTVKLLASTFALSSIWKILSWQQQRAVQLEKKKQQVALANNAPAAPTEDDNTTATEPSEFDLFPPPTPSQSASARRSMAISNLDTLRRKTRQSLAATATNGYAANTANTQPATAPFTVGIVTPLTLARYGKLLQDGFNEYIQRDADIVNKVELLVPNQDESHSAFAARVRGQNLNVLIIQYHGSSEEDVIAFLDYGVNVQRILLLHRPEEILERHAQHVFKQDQFNILHLLRDVDVSVVLGEAARPMVQKALPADEQETVCVVPHGFSSIDDTLAKPRSLSPVVIGALTNFNDMRWLADIVQMHDVTLKSQQRADAPTHVKNARLVFYVAGRFSTYVDPTDKSTMIDEYTRLTTAYPERFTIVSKSRFDEAERAGEITTTDMGSFKNFLWQLSDSGKKIVLCRDDAASGAPSDLFASSLQRECFDFTVQLFREHLKNFAPKMEFSGALHAQPGAALPIVFESTAMGDVEIEGMKLLTVPYEQPTDCNSTECCPWYTQSVYCPDFRPAVDAIFKYLQYPSHYHSHRQASLAAGKEMTMRHVAAQYAQIIRSINGI